MKVSENNRIIYLDNAATSWPKPEGVADTVSDFIKKGCANPGRSGHRMSVDTARMIFSVRDAVAELFGCSDPLRIAFGYNATSALNAAISGLIKPGDHVITSGMEHNSVMRPLRALEAAGVELTVLPGNVYGAVDPDDLRKAIRKNSAAVVMTHASNVTGTVMPIEDIAKITSELEIPFIVDAAQSAGVIPINLDKTPVDMLAFTGHKGLYGPQGTGGLYIRNGLEERVRALISGGTGSKSEKEEQPEFMPDKFESGTPNSPGIAGLGAGIEFINRIGVENIRNHEQKLTTMLIEGVRALRGVTIYGPPADGARTSVVSINIEGIAASEATAILDEEFGIMTRPGLHCAPGAHRTIGTFPGGTVRFSIGYFNTEEDIKKTISAVESIAARYGG